MWGEARNARRKGQKYSYDDILHYGHIMLKIQYIAGHGRTSL